jgi:hypothetical protein
VTSTVTNYTKTFDETYPKAGADNNSQQFRDNFAAIKVAFTATSNELSDLQSKVVLKSALAGTTLDNNFAYNSISNVNLVNHSYTVKNWVDTVPTAVNYSQGQYQSLVLPEGANTVNITGVPTATEDNEPRMGSMIVVVSTSSTATTTVSFTSDVAGISVVNLGPTAQPFVMDDNIPLMFEIWATSADTAEPNITPKLYIKKLTEFIKPDIYDNNNVSSLSFLGDNATFVTTVRTGRSISIGNNTYSTGTTTGTVSATVVTDGTRYNNLAVVPNRVIAVVTTATVDSPGDTVATRFGVASVTGIAVGASVNFYNTWTTYVVSNIDLTNKIITTTSAFPVGIGSTATFINPQFVGQPVVATLSPTNNSGNLVGSVYANTTTLTVVFSTQTSTATNVFSISNVLVNSITAGSGTSITTSTGNVIFTNTGVLSITASATTSGIYVNTSSGYVVISPSANSNGYGQRFISSSPPANSDGVNGDIWYKI